jgi:hypothetical protein
MRTLCNDRHSNGRRGDARQRGRPLADKQRVAFEFYHAFGSNRSDKGSQSAQYHHLLS